MKSVALGGSISPAEVTNVSPHGFWWLIDERKLFVPFNEFPWFREASVRQITNVQLPGAHHLYWPDLDIGTVDLKPHVSSTRWRHDPLDDGRRGGPYGATVRR